ncbi:MAG: GGDEF domain-containing protein [Burkholderiales bacterium]|nr:GGDEF domain-containing protein [Burkholderiales bacterium]
MTASVAPANATELARETIRALAVKRIAPTPDNYARVYSEFAGDDCVHPALRVIEKVVAVLAQRPGLAGLAAAPRRGRWPDIEEALIALAPPEPDGPLWAALLRDLLRQWEARQDGLPQGRKREAFEHVLDASRSDSAKLRQRLGALVKSWSEAPPARALEVAGGATAEPAALAAPSSPQVMEPAVQGTASTVRAAADLLAETIELAATDRLSHAPELALAAESLAAQARRAQCVRDFVLLGDALRRFLRSVSARGESADALVRGLLTLLRVLMDNIGAVGGDRWLKEQLARADRLIEEPLDVRALREAERGFREAAHRQAVLKDSLDEAQNALKSMAGLLIDRLGVLGESADGYHDRFTRHAEKIAAAGDIAELSAVISELVGDTREARDDLKRTRDELVAARREADLRAAQVRALEAELESAGAHAREDQLTQVLNRRGLEEAFTVAVAAAVRSGEALSIGLLDVDNFKALNDRLGHQAGDEALRHLAATLRAALRPGDVVARYGGEEFVILLPNADVEAAREIMVRVQRALTRRFFLHDNERVLITFSAGVAAWQPGEEREAAIARADGAMYRAKKSGKNRVCVAE